MREKLKKGEKIYKNMWADLKYCIEKRVKLWQDRANEESLEGHAELVHMYKDWEIEARSILVLMNDIEHQHLKGLEEMEGEE